MQCFTNSLIKYVNMIQSKLNTGPCGELFLFYQRKQPYYKMHPVGPLTLGLHFPVFLHQLRSLRSAQLRHPFKEKETLHLA